MSATSMRRTDRTRGSEVLSAGVLLGSRGSSCPCANFERERKAFRHAASRRTALPGAPRGRIGLTMEMAR